MNLGSRIRPYLVLLGLGLVATAPAVGLRFDVETEQDGGDATPGDGVCATAIGHCSLRAAVDEANALAGPDSIVLPAGVFALSPAPGGFAAGRIRILDQLDIQGAGMDETFIDGGDSLPILYVSAVRVEISGLTIRNGNAGGPEFGSVIESFGQLTVDRCRLTGNQGHEYAAVILNGGSLLISDSVLEENRGPLITTDNSLTLDGVVVRRNEGGIEVNCGHGPVIRHSEIAENGAGIYGCPTVTDSVIRDNGAAAIACPGGGVVVARSTISDNRGEGINSDGSVWVVDSTIRGNSRSRENAAAVSGLGAVGSGGIVAIGHVTVQSSTIEGNFGRGIDVEIWASLENVTVTGNRDGGVYFGDQRSTIESSTIVDNGGPGIELSFEGQVVVRNSIVSGNLDDEVSADCRGAVEFAGYNLLGSSEGCEATLDTTDRVGIDPMIASLRNEGGPTSTRPPLDGSPAIDGGPMVGSTACRSFDQRAVRRPQGERCDIGAVERLAACGDGSIDVGEDCDDGNLVDDDCCSSLCRFSAVVVGDCDGDGSVAISDLVFAVGLASGHTVALECAATDRDGDLQIEIAELIAAVRNAIDGVQLSCPDGS